jgi:hypothetical protein
MLTNNELYFTLFRELISCAFFQPYEWWVIELAIHGPLWAVQGHMGHSHIYTLTPPRSLDYRRSGVQDWPTKKETHTQGPPAATTSHWLR